MPRARAARDGAIRRRRHGGRAVRSSNPVDGVGFLTVRQLWFCAGRGVAGNPAGSPDRLAPVALFEPLFDALNRDGIRYVVAGGVAVVLRVGPTAVRVASIGDLIALKRLANRPQDLQDIAELEEIQKRRGGGGG